jgi:hypothetical protein
MYRGVLTTNVEQDTLSQEEMLAPVIRKLAMKVRILIKHSNEILDIALTAVDTYILAKVRCKFWVWGFVYYVRGRKVKTTGKLFFYTGRLWAYIRQQSEFCSL